MEFFAFALGLLLALGIIWLLKLIFFKPFNINHFFERSMFGFALTSPELMSQIRILEKAGIYCHNKKLDNHSEAFLLKQEAQLRRNLKILHSYSREKLKPQQQLSYDILQWFLEDMVAGEKFRHHDYPVNQLFGVQNQLPTFMATTHQIKSKRDARHYIIRLSKVKRKFEQVLEGLKLRTEKGIIPPLFVIEKVLAEMENFIAVQVENNILYTTMSEKLAGVKEISEKERAAFLAKGAEQIRDTVYPAYQLLISYFQELKTLATSDAGVWKLPEGEEYYQYLLRHYTTTDFTPEEIHQLGLKEVGRIQSQMQGILTDLGYTGKNPIELMQDLAQEPRFAYAEESGPQVLKDYQAIIDWIEGNLDNLFALMPKAGVIVERIPEFKEKTAPGAYYNPPAMDGSRPGIFSVNLLQLPKKYDMETLAYHEAIPGHHFQLAIQQELKGLPTFRRILPFTAYAEGWALYAEKLAWENNLFSDQYSVLGYLASELFRAVRLVVDTGIHYKRWTREEAIEYMVSNSGTDYVNAIIEIERYIVMPGQATAYKIGELEILRLREMARQQGAAFDIKEFHSAILKNGSVPLNILEKLVEEAATAETYPACRG